MHSCISSCLELYNSYDLSIDLNRILLVLQTCARSCAVQYILPQGGFPVIAETTRNHTFSKEISQVILAAMVLAPNFCCKNCQRVIPAIRGNPPSVWTSMICKLAKTKTYFKSRDCLIALSEKSIQLKSLLA